MDSPLRIAPDVVFPHQFFASQRRQALQKRGECRLLVAILEDAVACYQRCMLAGDYRSQRLFREAEKWIMGPGTPAKESDSPTFGFEYVCDVLGLESNYIRAGLLRWRQRQLSRASVTRSALGRQPAAGGAGSHQSHPL